MEARLHFAQPTHPAVGKAWLKVNPKIPLAMAQN